MTAPKTSLSPSFPTSLRTTTVSEGYALAFQLAASVLQQTKKTPGDMADNLRSGPALHSVEFLSVIYFHAITIANEGWRREPN